MQISLIHCLDVMLLIIILTPYARTFLMRNPFDKRNFGKNFSESFIFLAVCFFFLYPFFWIDQKKNFTFDTVFFLLAIITSILCVSVEILIFKFKYGIVRIKKLDKDNKILTVYLLLLLPIMEELLFRGFLFYILSLLGGSTPIFIILSSVSFGLCHFIYSPINIFTKILWGVGLSILFIITGSTVVYPIIAHITSNCFIVIYDFLTTTKGVQK